MSDVRGHAFAQLRRGLQKSEQVAAIDLNPQGEMEEHARFILARIRKIFHTPFAQTLHLRRRRQFKGST
jgi:hypothetical protein